MRFLTPYVICPLVGGRARHAASRFFRFYGPAKAAVPGFSLWASTLTGYSTTIIRASWVSSPARSLRL